MRIAVIEGDGIGPEVVNESLGVLEAICQKYGLNCSVDKFPYGADYYLKNRISIPEEVFIEWPKKYNAILFGAVGDPRVKPNDYAKEILLGLRFKLDLYVNYRPVKLLNEKFCPLKNIQEKDIDFVIFRENTEDLYTDNGGNFKKNTPDEIALENSIHTRKGVERIIKYAFEYADRNGLDSVLMSDKSNAMRYAGDLWQRTFREVGEQYPHIKQRHMFIDALHMQLIKDPGQFKVIVTSNVFGDILTDVSAQIQGGMGLSASANLNPENAVLKGMYEPIHGSAPDIAGKDIANPLASILSLAMLLNDQGCHKEAEVIYKAVKEALKCGWTTPELGGKYSTRQTGEFIRGYINQINDKGEVKR